MSNKVKAQLAAAMKRIEEANTNEGRLFGIDAYDMTDSNDGELSLIVFNTFELYQMRHEDVKGMLKMMKKAGFKWTKKQEAELMDDIKDDKEEMENEGYVEKVAEDFATSEESDSEADAAEVPAAEDEAEETVDAPEGDEVPSDDTDTRLTNIEDMIKQLFTAVMDGDETIDPDATPTETAEDLGDIETLVVSDATDGDVADGEEGDAAEVPEEGEEVPADVDDADIEVVDLDDVDDDVPADEPAADADEAPVDDADIEVMDIDDEEAPAADPESEEDDLEEGIVAALTFGNLTNPEWAKCVATLMGDNLQNTYPDH